MNAQIRKKELLCVTKLAVALFTQQVPTKKKSTISMYFNSCKEPLINKNNSKVLSNPISSDSNLEELESELIGLDNTFELFLLIRGFLLILGLG